MKKFTLIVALFASFFVSGINASTFEDDFAMLNGRLSANELNGKSADELDFMKNAIYAKYGFEFQSPELSQFFSQFDWYQPSVSNEAVLCLMMTPDDQFNIGRINMMQSGEGEAVQVLSTYYDFPYWIMNNRITMNDLYGLSCYELRVLRNHFYAYYGYIFKSDDLRYYFNQCSWYRGRYKSESKVYGMMSKLQKSNIETIKKRERQLGC